MKPFFGGEIGECGGNTGLGEDELLLLLLLPL